jgi:hypothetical protein
MNQRLAVLCALLACGAGVPAGAEVPLYTANYLVEYKGREMGASEFSVARGSEHDAFSFSSNTKLKGLVARLVSPRPVIEHSEFTMVAGQIRPRRFRYEDGSRKGEDNYIADFDWSAAQVTINGQSGPRTFPLTPGVLDRGSMQVALMNDAAAGRLPGPYVLADDDSLNTYEFTAEENAQVETALGTFTAQRLRQQRRGSSRHTILWLVPELRYLPVLIEQYRDGEVLTAFIIESLQWAEANN